MSPPLSPHQPGLSGGLEIVTAEMVVDTGLKDIQTVIATLNQQNIVPDEEATVSWYPFTGVGSKPSQIVLRVEKGGANSGLLGDSPVTVAWFALGRR